MQLQAPTTGNKALDALEERDLTYKLLAYASSLARTLSPNIGGFAGAIARMARSLGLAVIEIVEKSLDLALKAGDIKDERAMARLAEKEGGKSPSARVLSATNEPVIPVAAAEIALVAPLVAASVSEPIEPIVTPVVTNLFSASLNAQLTNSFNTPVLSDLGIHLSNKQKETVVSTKVPVSTNAGSDTCFSLSTLGSSTSLNTLGANSFSSSNLLSPHTSGLLTTGINSQTLGSALVIKRVP